jgi:hypothetical protein
MLGVIPCEWIRTVAGIIPLPLKLSEALSRQVNRYQLLDSTGTDYKSASAGG